MLKKGGGGIGGVFAAELGQNYEDDGNVHIIVTELQKT